MVDYLCRYELKLHKKAEEYLYLIVVSNTKVSSCSAPISIFMISKGSPTESVVDVKSIMKRVLLTSGNYIFLAHNHPSGSTNPSSEDIAATKKIKEACNLFNIKLLDHLIIGNNGSYSFEENLML